MFQMNIHEVRSVRAVRAWPSNGASVTLEIKTQRDLHSQTMFFDDIATSLAFYFANGGTVEGINRDSARGIPGHDARVNDAIDTFLASRRVPA